MNAPEIRARVVSREKKALTAKKAGFMRFDRKIRPSKKRRHTAQSDDELFRPYLAVPHLLIKKLHRYFRDLSNSYRACCYCLMNVNAPPFEVPVEKIKKVMLIAVPEAIALIPSLFELLPNAASEGKLGL